MSETVIKILKIGLPGLVFLLSLLSFKLLSQQSKKEDPSPDVLSSIRHYMYLNLILAILTVLSPIIEGKYFNNDQKFITTAILDDNGLAQGKVAVCTDSKYKNRFFLIRDCSTNKLVQVFSGSPIPCIDGEQELRINKEDAEKLGWQEGKTQEKVVVSVAREGYKFSYK